MGNTYKELIILNFGKNGRKVVNFVEDILQASDLDLEETNELFETIYWYLQDNDSAYHKKSGEIMENEKLHKIFSIFIKWYRE